MKRVLIAGGSHSDIPLIRAAQAHGFHVITSGNREADLGHQFADEVHLEDFSDLRAMLALAMRLRIDAICSSANDFSVITCAYIAEIMGLPGFDSYQTTLALHHKDRFRTLASQLNLPCPTARHFSTPDITPDDIADLTFPLMVKPIDLTGGKGISRIDSPDQLAASVNIAFSCSRAKRIVIETFFSGTLHSYSSVIRNQQVVFEYADNEFSFLNPYLVTTSTSPAKVDASIMASIRLSTEKLARHLQLADGLLHGQFLCNGKEFRIIEYTRRCPGDLYAVPVRHSTGVDHADLIVRPCLGMNLTIDDNCHQSGFFSRHCVMTECPGILRDIVISDEIRDNVMDIFALRKYGEPMVNHLVDKAAIIFLQYSSEAEMEDRNQRITSLIRAITEQTSIAAI